MNNGDAISCIIMALDSLARSNNAVVEIETLHAEACPLLVSTQGDGADISDSARYAEGALGLRVSSEVVEHLSLCACDPEIEAVFFAGNGKTLLFPLKFSSVKSDHPWLGDIDLVHQIVKTGMEHGSDSLLMGDDFESMLAAFRSGHGIAGSYSGTYDQPDINMPGTIH
mgnify:CR=1 FL=1